MANYSYQTAQGSKIMAARETLDHSTTYREDHLDNHASEAKHLQYAVENQEDWSRSDPGIRFTDELKKISDKAATAFDNGESLANYSEEELDHIVDSYLEAWTKLDFATDTDRREAADRLAHKVFEPMTSQYEYDQSHLDPTAVESLPKTDKNQVRYILGHDQNGEEQTLTGKHVLEPLDTVAIQEALSLSHLTAKQDMATMAYTDINRSRETFADTLYNSTENNYQETGQTLRDLVGEAATRYKAMITQETLAAHGSEHHQDLYINLSTPAGWTNTHNAIAHIYEQDPLTARAATKVAERIMDHYIHEIREALDDHNSTRFEELKDNVINFDTTFANTLKTGEGFVKGANYNQPELPNTFEDYDSALNYIQQVDDIITRLNNNELDTMASYKIALSNMSEDFTTDLHIIEEIAKSNDYPDPTYLAAIHRTATNIDFLLKPKDTDPNTTEPNVQGTPIPRPASAVR